MSNPTFLRFDTADAMNHALAAEIASRLTAGVSRNGQASLVASGGTTPGDLYDVLSREGAPWAMVTVTLSDERWVDPSSPRSNEAMIRSRLLQHQAAAAGFVPLKTAAPHAEAGEKEAGAAVAAMPRPFDVMLLGMGNDMHTASLVPGSEGLARALDTADPVLLRAIHPPESTGMGERITLTLSAILDARWIVLLIRGDAKLKAYEQAMAGRDVTAGPVRAVLQQQAAPVSVYWSP